MVTVSFIFEQPPAEGVREVCLSLFADSLSREVLMQRGATVEGSVDVGIATALLTSRPVLWRLQVPCALCVPQNVNIASHAT